MEEKKLNEIEELGRLQFSLHECGTVLGFNFDAFKKLMRKDGSILIAYNKGRLLAEAEVRKSILAQAKQGSTPAQKQMLDMINKNKKQQELRK